MKLTEGISGNNTGEQVSGAEGSNPKADDNSANNISEQSMGARKLVQC